MRIAILVRRLYPPGGAERSLLYLKNRLEDDHEVRIFGYYTETGYEYENAVLKPFPDIPLSSLPWISGGLNILFREIQLANGFRSEVSDFSPDLIFAQQDLSYLAVWLRLRDDVPCVVFLRGWNQLATHSTDAGLSRKLIEIFKMLYFWPLNYATLNIADEVIANSNYTADRYADRYPSLNPDVVYPFVSADDYQISAKGEKILHYAPNYEKGIDITLNIAENMPEQDFIVVGIKANEEVYKKMEEFPNVEYVGYVDDMREIYRCTKLVLYPSRWDEPFGRIPIEAGINGIPTICSGSGGLKESVGHDELIVESNHSEDYISRIEFVLENYEQFSRIAKDNAIKKTAETQFQSLIDQLTQSLPTRVSNN